MLHAATGITHLPIKFKQPNSNLSPLFVCKILPAVHMESELNQQSLVQLHHSELTSEYLSSECTDLEIQGTNSMSTNSLAEDFFS